MRRHWKKLVLLAAAAAITACVLFALFSSEPEPSYKGRKLSEWIVRKNDQAETEAMLHMGTNALPRLVTWACYSPPTWRQKLQRLCRDHPSVPNFLEDWAYKCEERAEESIHALALLQTNAYPALPQLLLIANDNQNELKALFASWSIYSTLHGPPPHSPQNIDSIEAEALNGPDPNLRQAAKIARRFRLQHHPSN